MPERSAELAQVMPTRRPRWRRLLATLTAMGLTMGMVAPGWTADKAAAEPVMFNPFAVNQGFTILAEGDLALNNGELEGAAAAFGTASSGNSNGFGLLHDSAGVPDYSVPTIDGAPVRLLAESFIGSGSFDISNRDDSGTTSPDSPEENAIAKLVDTSGLAGQPRSGGAGSNTSGEFLRATNTDSGFLDLKALGADESDVSELQTELGSVSAYFGDVDAATARTNQCFDSMYDPDAGLVNTVTVTDEGGLVYVEDFATDRPNVIDYEDIAGQTIKMDRADGYRPTAEAPLVVRVDEGTTDLGQLDFEGWSAGPDAEQNLSNYMMLDLSAVTGTVTIDGLEMGSIWAPNADLEYSSGVTTNGQWFANDITTSGGGEIHHHAFQGQLPCSTDDEAVPSISSSASVNGSDENLLPSQGGTVTDTISYENLAAGQEYQLHGSVHTVPDGEPTGIESVATFTADASDGTAVIEFEVTADQAAEYAGQTLVIYQSLSQNGSVVTEHRDPNDAAQQFAVAETVEPSPRPNPTTSPTPTPTPTPTDTATPTPTPTPTETATPTPKPTPKPTETATPTPTPTSTPTQTATPTPRPTAPPTPTPTPTATPTPTPTSTPTATPTPTPSLTEDVKPDEDHAEDLWAPGDEGGSGGRGGTEGGYPPEESSDTLAETGTTTFWLMTTTAALLALGSLLTALGRRRAG
ncbi:VaFE repeat-containing surface-anchored protein [Cellulosimicrobium funkei]|nr:VaFE repeat-containing surface-anchored protein [Cellulosimicrobium funkei]